MAKTVELLSASWFVSTQQLLSVYWESTPWQEGGDFAAKRLDKEIKKYARLIRELPGNLIPMAMDQYLAATWHAAEANRAAVKGGPGERFGGKPWLFTPFLVAEDLGNFRYLCAGESGEAFHLYSPGVAKNLRGGSRIFLALLLDVGEGWKMSYGPLYGWVGLLPGDLSFFASRVARQRFDSEGFDAVVRADPVPFWAAWYYGTKPFVMHGPGAILSAWIEGSLDPSFGEGLPRTWKREDQGKRTRWIHGEDFFHRKDIYLNRSTNEALLYARTDEDLEKTRKLAGAAFTAKGKAERCGILMEIILKDLLGVDPVSVSWERPFGQRE